MVHTARMRFFQTSADVRTTILAAKHQWESANPGRWFMKGQIVAASPGDEDGNRWVDIEFRWTAT
jgi:hypothetical protein